MYSRNKKERSEVERVSRALSMARVGTAIREKREAKRMTLRQLADAVEVSVPFLCDVEHGRRTTRKLTEIEKILGLKKGWLTEIAGLCPTCGGSGFDPANEKERLRDG